jgi:hypothetical protein
MVLASGESAIVYNPYSLDELSAGVVGVTAYVTCLSTASDPDNQCPRPPREDTSLRVLTGQGVEPIAVWAKCKANYAASAWDVGAGAMFWEMPADDDSGVPSAVRKQAIAWASGISPNLLACLQSSVRLRQDYGACQRMFFSLRQGSTPSAYYLYQPASSTTTNFSSSEPPDACRVFTGLAAAAANGSQLQTLMSNCIMAPTSDVTACDLNPFVWSATAPQKLGVAGVHGTTPPGAQTLLQQTEALYAAEAAKLRSAHQNFLRDFVSDATHLDLAVFSADGDLLHEFFDCLFLGPYHRVDLRACDAEVRGLPRPSGPQRDGEGALSVHRAPPPFWCAC